MKKERKKNGIRSTKHEKKQKSVIKSCSCVYSDVAAAQTGEHTLAEDYKEIKTLNIDTLSRVN